MKRISKQDLLGIGMTSQRRRDSLIERLAEKGIKNKAVLDVMSTMPRHLFIDEAMANRAYEDCSLPIGFGQTISQPFIVARMTEEILGSDVKEKFPKRVLEVGTGSGYQAAVLSLLVEKVYTVERIQGLHIRAKELYQQLRFNNIHCQYTDGTWGWEANAPYEAIIVTAAPETLPDSLLQQLTIGGRMIIPVGAQEQVQKLLKVCRVSDTEYEQEELELVSFVPFKSGRS